MTDRATQPQHGVAAEPIDAEARRQAIDVHRSAIVQAPAGSGKTELLTQRCLALLGIAERPDEIVALTFTRKAAGEMQDRILRALAVAASEPMKPAEKILPQTIELAEAVLARDRQLGWGLLRNPAQLRVQTIDALCLRMAQTSPLDAPPATQVIDDAEELYEEAARGLVREIGENDAALSAAMRCVLLHLDGDSKMLRRLMSDMLARRDQWQRHIPATENAAAFRAELEQTLQRVVCRTLQSLRNAFPAAEGAELPALARFALANGSLVEGLSEVGELKSLPGASVVDLPRWRAIRDFLFKKDGKEWRKSVTVREGFPAGTGQNSAQKSKMQALLARCAALPALGAAMLELEYLPPTRLDEGQWQVAQALFHLLPRSVELLEEVFAKHDLTDFALIAQAARAITERRPAQAGIRHLLIDEYQDTSLTQQKLFESLVAKWKAGDARTVFLVGDPKQSIYRFRQAQVELFLETYRRRKLGPVQLDALSLSANFRSQPKIVEWVNETFEQLFDAGAPGDDSPPALSFGRSSAERRAQGPSVQVVADVQFKDQLDDSDEREARRVAEIISAERRRDPRSRIAVLVRAREHVARIIPQLQAHTIPVVAVEIERLGETQIVLDLLALTRALLHPADRIAWLAVLRAPWCGLELADLELLCGAEPRACVPDLIARRRTLLTPDAQARLQRVLPALEAAMGQRGRRPLSHLVEGAWIALGGPACLPEGELPNAKSFLRVLHETEVAGDIADWQLLTRRTQKLFAQHQALDPNPVQLMTIHKAKGLEFDVVLVPGLGKRAGREDDRLLRWLERDTPDGAELFLAPAGPRGGDTDPLFRYLRHLDLQSEEQEARRIAYVAATRARDALYLLGCAEGKSDGSAHIKPRTGSLLALLWPALGADFEREALRRMAQREPSPLAIAAQAETTDTWLRLPAHWAFPASPTGVRSSAVPALPEKPITFEWVSDLRRHAGTVIHAMLQRIASAGIDEWNSATVAASQGLIANLLRQEGIARADLASATAEVSRALEFAVSDVRGRWCLSAHQRAESELDLTGVLTSGPQRIRIDRTFIAEGVRWIIDFKTGLHEGAGLERFLDEEVERYREQLEHYAALLRPLEANPIRIGIFFPLAHGWREWEPKTKAAAAG
jgi:ATP-dependent helicase/nuclease subunit A